MKCETAILQRESELHAFMGILAKEHCRSYLEIGSKFGGSLWRIANSLPKGARVVSVDLPHGDKSFKESQQHLEECVAALEKRGYDAHLILGDSTDGQIIEQVYSLGPFDAAFIDANHTEPFVRADFANYSQVAKLIAFHDISFFRAQGMPPGKKPIEVPRVWNEIKNGRRYTEIKHDKQDNGIGVLWL
jgi:predicted O-methyltransferase YrrM